MAEVEDWAALLDRHSSVEVERIDQGAQISWTTLSEFAADPRECAFRLGALTGLIGSGTGFAPSRIRHPECRAHGADACLFVADGVAPEPDSLHALVLRESFALSAALEGREALFRRMYRSSAHGGPLPDVRQAKLARRFMEELEDIILIFDRNLCVLDANRAAVQFSGMTLDALRGCSARDLLSPESYRAARESLPLLVAAGAQRGLRVDARTREGWVPLELSARLSASGETIVCMGRDIGQHLRLERELEERNRQLRAQNEKIRGADLLKSEFLANVSHELATPLTCIKGFARLLHREFEESGHEGDEPLPDEKRAEFLRIILNETSRMGDLIGGLLELSKIESGGVALDRSMVSLNAIVEESLLVLKPRLDEADLTVNLQLDPGPMQGSLDPDRIKQVVLNLIDNAIKFSPKGSRPELRTRVVKNMLELSVRNAASDLTEESLPRLFDRFFQRDGSFARLHGGVGLGLDLVRAIVELHGGRVWAELPGSGWLEILVRLPRG